MALWTCRLAGSPRRLHKFLGCCLVWRVAYTKPLSVINTATGTREGSRAGSFIYITRAQLLIIFELNMLARPSCLQQCTKRSLYRSQRVLQANVYHSAYHFRKPGQKCACKVTLKGTYIFAFWTLL